MVHSHVTGNSLYFGSGLGVVVGCGVDIIVSFLYVSAGNMSSFSFAVDNSAT